MWFYLKINLKIFSMKYILIMFSLPNSCKILPISMPTQLYVLSLSVILCLVDQLKNDKFSLVSWNGIKFIKQVPFSVHRFKHSWDIFFPVHYCVTGVNIYALSWHDGNHLSLVFKFFWPDSNMCETSFPDLTRSHRIALCISGSNLAVISPNALYPSVE